jgi:hypothetical protein
MPTIAGPVPKNVVDQAKVDLESGDKRPLEIFDPLRDAGYSEQALGDMANDLMEAGVDFSHIMRHDHVVLSIGGAEVVQIPSDLGFEGGALTGDFHTHEPSGTQHLESYPPKQVLLKDILASIEAKTGQSLTSGQVTVDVRSGSEPFHRISDWESFEMPATGEVRVIVGDVAVGQGTLAKLTAARKEAFEVALGELAFVWKNEGLAGFAKAMVDIDKHQSVAMASAERKLRETYPPSVIEPAMAYLEVRIYDGLALDGALAYPLGDLDKAANDLSDHILKSLRTLWSNGSITDLRDALDQLHAGKGPAYEKLVAGFESPVPMDVLADYAGSTIIGAVRSDPDLTGPFDIISKRYWGAKTMLWHDILLADNMRPYLEQELARLEQPVNIWRTKLEVEFGKEGADYAIAQVLARKDELRAEAASMGAAPA